MKKEVIVSPKTEHPGPYFVVLIGLPCSGKTTFTESIKDHIVLSSDEVIEGIGLHVGKSYSEVWKDIKDPATKIVEAQIPLLTYQKANVVIDKTNLTKKSRAKTLELIKNKKDYRKIAVYFEVPDEILDARLQERNKTGKVISPEIMKKMKSSYQIPTKDEGFHEIIKLDFSVDPEEEAA
jgi:predicted kinase